MDTEQLREIVNSALNEMSAEAIAALADGIAAKSVYNFASGATKEPLRSTRRGLDRFAEMWEAGLRSKGEYIDGTGAVRADMRPVAGLVPVSVQGIVREGQREQMAWVRDFAARLLEAQAAAIRMMDASWLSEEDLDGDIEAAEKVEAAKTRGRQTATGAKKKSARG